MLDICVMRMLTQRKQIEGDVGSRVKQMRRSQTIEVEDQRERPLTTRLLVDRIGSVEESVRETFFFFDSWKFFPQSN